MKIKKIAHLAFKVSNMEESLNYYCNGLGLKQKFSLDNSAGQPWLTYLEVAEGQFLELFYDYESLKSQEKNDSHIGYLHFCIEVENIQETKKRLLEYGLPIISDIMLGSDNTYQIWSSDPDGNKIEFMEYTENSLQMQENSF